MVKVAVIRKRMWTFYRENEEETVKCVRRDDSISEDCRKQSAGIGLGPKRQEIT